MTYKLEASPLKIRQVTLQLTSMNRFSYKTTTQNLAIFSPKYHIYSLKKKKGYKNVNRSEPQIVCSFGQITINAYLAIHEY